MDKNYFQKYAKSYNHYNCNHEDIEMEDNLKEINFENNEHSQVQLKINKQLMEQKISEEYTNDMLGKALSTAEYLSSRFGKEEIKKRFNYYNLFDSGITKDKENLKKLLMISLDALQYYYEIDNNNKRFPSNFTEKDIITYIEKLRDNYYNKDQNNKDKDIFGDFITIIKGGKVNFSSYFKSNAKVDPNILVTSGVDTIKFAGRQENEWKEKAIKQGDYQINLKIDMDWNNNKHVPKRMNNIKNFN